MLELNKIYNEDCLKGLKKIPDNSIDLVLIDPPYDICTAGGKKGNDRITKNKKKVESELITNNLVNGFDFKILDELIRVMKGINIYIWCNVRQIPMYIKYFNLQLKCKLEVLIWNKTNPIPLHNHAYMNDKEYCLYFRNNGYCNPKNYEDSKTVYISTINVNDKKLYNHPTIKPLSLTRKIIRNSSKEQETVLDCFLGSGTTAVACILENRNYIGFEIDKKYYDIALKRIEEAIKMKEEENK